MHPTRENIKKAVSELSQGRLVAFPTETVYGLGADAECGAAVAAIYRLKGRPSHNPLIVHVSSEAMAKRYVQWGEVAAQLAAAYWPGPLTLVLRRSDSCPTSPLVSAGMDTVAIRMPSHPVPLEIIEQLGRGVAAPSANRSGRISPTTATHVVEEFSDEASELAMILDGGEAKIGIESTVVDCTGERPVVLRKGSITAEEIQAVVGVSFGVASGQRRVDLRSPGMLSSHYAPNALLRLNAHDVYQGEALLAFGATLPAGASLTCNLSKTADMHEAAHRLYQCLRELDATGCAHIAVMPIPDEGIGEAINDRLRRAAAPR